MRIRFNHTVSGYLFFTIRQGDGGGYIAQWNRQHLAAMEKKEHELIFVCTSDGGPFQPALADGGRQQIR